MLGVKILDAKRNKDFYLFLMIFIAVSYILYWTYFEFYRYSTFQSSYFDMGYMPHSLYLHLYAPQLVPGLQYLVFGEHLSLFAFPLLGVFAVIQSPITLILLQEISLGLASIVTYIIGKNLLRNRMLGLTLGLAFLINAGVRGITVYDFHLEGFIPLFYLLAFYFYMDGSKKWFAIVYTLLLSTIETSLAVGLTLLAGLFFYEFVCNKKLKGVERIKQQNRIRMLFLGIAITAAFGVFYISIANSLTASYQSGEYSLTPPNQKLINFFSFQLQTLENPGGVAYDPYSLYLGGSAGLINIFLGFGITSLVNPLLTMIFTSPWIGEVFVLHNLVFATFYNEYYAYAIGGALVSSVLGILIVSKTKVSRLLKWIFPSNPYQIAGTLLSLSVIISILLFLITFPLQPFLLNNAPNLNYSQIDSQLSKIPTNASLMTDVSLNPHLYYVQNLELTPNIKLEGFTPSGFSTINAPLYWFKPTYIAFDKNLSDFNTIQNTNFSIYTYMGSNYTLYSSTQGLEIYRLR